MHLSFAPFLLVAFCMAYMLVEMPLDSLAFSYWQYNIWEVIVSRGEANTGDNS